jgi:hypothetical protein
VIETLNTVGVAMFSAVVIGVAAYVLVTEWFWLMYIVVAWVAVGSGQYWVLPALVAAHIAYLALALGLMWATDRLRQREAVGQ